MPEGRMVSKSIAHSEQLNEQVSLHADYLFTRCIPHLDREGRIPGNPQLVKSITCPLRPEITIKGIPGLLRELASAGLVKWYRADGKDILEFPGFAKHQKGARFDREAPSRLPAFGSEGTVDLLRTKSGPTPDELRSRTGAGPDPAEVRLSEVKLSEAKGSEVEEQIVVADAPAGSWAKRACEMWDDRFGGKGPYGRIGKALRPLVEKHGEKSVLDTWGKYLIGEESQYANPQDFASKYGVWANGGHRNGAKPPPEQTEYETKPYTGLKS